MFDIWVSGRMQFTDDDRRECLDTVVKIIELANISRKYGILAIEEEIQNSDDIFLRKGLAMAIDMQDPDYIRHILQRFIIAGDYRGGALLKRLVIIDGVISIAVGENPKMMCDNNLASLFGEDFMPEYEKYCMDKMNSIKNQQVEAFLNEIKNKRFSEDTNLLEEIFAKLNDVAMQVILREIDARDLKISILGSSESVVSKVFKNVSKRNVEQIVEDCTVLGKNVRWRDITASQEKILAKIKELEEAGRIVLSK